MSHDAAILVGLLFALVLAVMHLAGPRLRPVPGLEPVAGASLAGGLAAAYVFVHVLPELARGNEEVEKHLGHALPRSDLLEATIFLLALLGFFVFFVLQWAAEQAAKEGGRPSDAVFRGHIVAFTAYNALVVYTVPLRLEIGAALGLLFCAILGLHLIATDRLLGEQFPQRFGEHQHGRGALAGGALGGWLLAIVVPEGTVGLTLLTAFLGGAILLNVLDQELPARHEARIGWFSAGLLISALVLTALELLGEHGAA